MELNVKNKELIGFFNYVCVDGDNIVLRGRAHTPKALVEVCVEDGVIRISTCKDSYVVYMSSSFKLYVDDNDMIFNLHKGFERNK